MRTRGFGRLKKYECNSYDLCSKSVAPLLYLHFICISLIHPYKVINFNLFLSYTYGKESH